MSRNAVSTLFFLAAHVSESPNTTRAKLTANTSRRRVVRDSKTNELSQVRRERRRQSDLSTLSRINLNVEDGTIHPSLMDCFHSALNGLPVILLDENQHFKLHCSDKFNALKDSMQLYHCSKPDGCQGRRFKLLN